MSTSIRKAATRAAIYGSYLRTSKASGPSAKKAASERSRSRSNKSSRRSRRARPAMERLPCRMRRCAARTFSSRSWTRTTRRGPSRAKSKTIAFASLVASTASLLRTSVSDADARRSMPDRGARIESLEVARCELQEGRPVRTRRVSAFVLPIRDVAVDQCGSDRREFARTEISFPEESVHGTRRNRCDEHALGIDPSVSFLDSARPDENGARRGERDEFVRIDRQVVPRKRSSVLEIVSCEPVIRVGTCGVLHELAEVAAMRLGASGAR